MRRMLAAGALSALAVLVLAGGQNAAAQTSVTIYNDGRVLVRRSVAAQLPKGASTQRLSIGAVDPATLVSLDSTVVIDRTVYDGAVDEMSVLRRSVGRRVVFQVFQGVAPRDRGFDTVSALVLGVDPMRFQLLDGRVSFSLPGTPLYPADVVVIDPVATLSLRSTRVADRLRLAYFTTGASWQASYDVVLAADGQAGGRARVNGSAVLSSESLRAEDTEVQLLAGSVSRAPMPFQADMERRRDLGKAVAAMQGGQQAPSEESVGEFHVYSLPGRTTLVPGLTTSIALFEPATVPYEKHFVVHGAMPYWGFIPQQPDEAEVPVEVRYIVKRPRKTALGDRPLPGGVARVYQSDTDGRVQLVGEAAIKHTAPGHDLELVAGNAFDLSAQRVQTTYTTQRDSLPGGWRTLATADYRVTLRNETDSAATIEVLEERAGEWKVLASSVPAEKVSSTVVRFRVAVPARGQAVLTYRIQAVW